MEKDLEALHEATLTVLKRTGVKVDSPRALEYLAGVGVRVDSSARRVYPEASHFAEALATTPRSITLHGRRPDRDRPVVLGGEHRNVMCGGGSLRVLTLDGRYEPATWEHLRQFNILLDALPNIHMLLNEVDPVDHTGPGFYRRLAAEMLTGSTKPLSLQAASGDDVQAMIEMGVEIRGSLAALVERPLFMMELSAEPPLHISSGVTEALITACGAGIPVSLCNYGLMGVTAPVTVAGAVVQINAVQMVAIILAQAVRRGAPICYASFAGSADLHTLDVNASTPHACQLLRLGIEMGRYYGLPIHSLVTADARAADPQAACERATGLLIGFEAGAHLLHGPTSSMDRFMLSSYVQAVIDNDIAGYVLAARRRPSVSPETLAVEAGHDVANDPQFAQLKFASHPHTVRHLRDEIWTPWAFAYDDFAAWDRAGRVSVVERAAAKAREILATHRPEPLPDSIATAIRHRCC